MIKQIAFNIVANTNLKEGSLYIILMKNKKTPVIGRYNDGFININGFEYASYSGQIEAIYNFEYPIL